MTTPAIKMGLVVNETRVQIKGREGEWVFDYDDSTYSPRFMHDTGYKDWFHLENVTILNDNPFPQPDVEPPVLHPAPLPLPIPTVDPIELYPVWQRRAYECFNGLYEAAVSYREKGLVGKLCIEAGICENIKRFTDYESQMVCVKDNLIRTVPSYSGSYHYPVKASANHTSAESAWDHISDKWLDEYGENRLIQLGELVEAIRTRWDEKLIGVMTPAERFGLKVGDVVWDKVNCELLTFRSDDGSNDPYFTRVTVDMERTSRHLDHIERHPTDKLTGAAIGELIARVEEIKLSRERINEAKKALDVELENHKRDIALIDFELAFTHKVKRLDA